MELELEPRQLGSLELDGQWVPYVDLPEFGGAIPTRVKLGNDEYGFNSSVFVFGHGAVLPQKVRELRSAGKKVLVLERGASGSGHSDRYFVFVSPP